MGQKSPIQKLKRIKCRSLFSGFRNRLKHSYTLTLNSLRNAYPTSLLISRKEKTHILQADFYVGDQKYPTSFALKTQ